MVHLVDARSVASRHPCDPVNEPLMPFYQLSFLAVTTRFHIVSDATEIERDVRKAMKCPVVAVKYRTIRR